MLIEKCNPLLTFTCPNREQNLTPISDHIFVIIVGDGQIFGMEKIFQYHLKCIFQIAHDIGER